MIDCCRCCGGPDLELVLDLGHQPLADGLQPTRAEALNAPRFPLRLALCTGCGLHQLLETPPPQTLFGAEFPYFSAVSSQLVKHAEALVERVCRSQVLGPDSLAIEIASNDGYLLQHFQARGIPVLGIDPASAPVAAAHQKGIETLERFFAATLAEELASEGRLADVIIANNVLAHVPDPIDFLHGVRRLLKSTGLAVMEVAWGRSLLTRRAFDTIYHEHHCYFTASTVIELFRRAGLAVVAIEPVEVHGGSLRIHAAHQGTPDAATLALARQEHSEGLFNTACWRSLSVQLEQVKSDLRTWLGREQSKGLRLAGYGAAAKGTMLLNWAGIDGHQLGWVADANVFKQGKFIPGVGLEVVDPQRIVEDRPDRILLLPWNWADEIASQQRPWLASGGRFILPLPQPRYFPD